MFYLFGCFHPQSPEGDYYYQRGHCIEFVAPAALFGYLLLCSVPGMFVIICILFFMFYLFGCFHPQPPEGGYYSQRGRCFGLWRRQPCSGIFCFVQFPACLLSLVFCFSCFILFGCFHPQPPGGGYYSQRGRCFGLWRRQPCSGIYCFVQFPACLLSLVFCFSCFILFGCFCPQPPRGGYWSQQGSCFYLQRRQPCSKILFHSQFFHHLLHLFFQLVNLGLLFFYGL